MSTPDLSEAHNSKKRACREMEDDNADDLDPSALALANMSRSERKRHREKKRRSDVNKGFDDLLALLLEIDPTVRSEASNRSRLGNWKATVGSQDDNLLSRVDLISRAVTVFRRVHRENEDRKQIIANLTRSDVFTSCALMPARTGNHRVGNSSRETNRQAAVESSQYYRQPFLNAPPTDNSSVSLLSRQPLYNLLGFNGSTIPTRPDDLIAYANGARVAANIANETNHNDFAYLSGTNNISTTVNPSMPCADAASLSLIRHYRHLLQTQQDTATMAQLMGVSSQLDSDPNHTNVDREEG